MPRIDRSPTRKTFGDYPTPPGLVLEVLEAIGPAVDRASRVLEPTCGRGHFLAALLDRPGPPGGRDLRGIEIQPDHADAARGLGEGRSVEVLTADLFGLDLGHALQWSRPGTPLLVVGNLPWVTTSGLGRLGGSNGPERSNARGARGLDALTGAANFDIAEAIWVKLIRELAAACPTIALLCKATAARAVLRRVGPEALPVTRAEVRRVDARRWFGAAVDACLLVVAVGPGPIAREATVYDGLTAAVPSGSLDWEGGNLVADRDAYRRSRHLDGSSPIGWRQGFKHDLADVMELTHQADGSLRNRLGAEVDVEAEFVFPWLKGTDVAGPTRPRPQRSVIVPQRHLGDDTRTLADRAPRLWAYLNHHAARFAARRSSIYRNRPPFAVFGVGDYTFAPHKVAVSSLHRRPHFRAVGPVAERPTLVDDTCYFLPCRDRDHARGVAEALNGPEVRDLIRGLAFPDAKRTVTKAILQRIDYDRVGRGAVDRAVGANP